MEGWAWDGRWEAGGAGNNREQNILWSNGTVVGGRSRRHTIQRKGR